MIGAIGAVTLGLPDHFSRLALRLATLDAAFAIGVLTLSPFDPWWQASTAADRLLLPAAAFALLAALATVAGAVSDAAATPDASRGTRGPSRRTASVRQNLPGRITLDAVGIFLLAAGIVATTRYFEDSLGTYDEG